MKNIEIEVCERLMDRTWDDKPKFYAQIKDEPGYWSCGESINEAIGGLINAHNEKFNISITDLGKLPR